MPKKVVKGKLIPIPSLKIKYKDVFDLKEFYKALREWCLEYEWGSQNEGSDQWGESKEGGDKWESYYGERVSSGGAKEIFIWWRLFKPAKDARYVNYFLDMDFHIIGLMPTEVVKDGMKIKANKGEIELKIRGNVQLEYTAKFEEHAVLKHVEKLFTKRIYTAHTEHEKELSQVISCIVNF